MSLYHFGQKGYPPFRKHCAREDTIEELFSKGFREIVAIDCATKLLGTNFRGDCTILLLLSAFLLFLYHASRNQLAQCGHLSQRQIFLRISQAGLPKTRDIIVRNNL